MTDWLGASHHDRAGHECREAIISAGEALWRQANSALIHR